ncbi:hypothetical protein OVA24_16255 [Luteolibacter sp. SL250]|uniref:hypothetical protein n=1 Tax=Luteolibacter sp. SL250 TaxID=2995170 RepID=UPI00226ECF9D|nr:hypothetical protein [Luteolibacter sp. SL250]WAC18783.1 hypothetical protein OVA24_16255 [Luteolibacter sp. SL250]
MKQSVSHVFLSLTDHPALSNHFAPCSFLALSAFGPFRRLSISPISELIGSFIYTVRQQNKMKTTSQLICSIAAVCLISSCKRAEEAQRLSYAEVLKEAEGKEGEIVAVQGRNDVTTYIRSGSATMPIGHGGGTTYRGLTMKLPDSPGYYHQIDLYDGSDGGGLLIGRKIAADPKEQK